MAVTASLLVLTACSPHPGSGTWLVDSPDQNDMARLVVHFEPSVDIYARQAEQASLQCGWWAKDRQSIEMECVQLDNTEKKMKYLLNVVASDRAELKQGDQLLGRYHRQQN